MPPQLPPTATAPAPLPAAVLARCAELPQKPDAPTLVGTRVTLRPLVIAADLDALYAVSHGTAITRGPLACEAYDADERIWRWMADGPFADAATLGGWLEAGAASPDACSLTIVVEGVPVGIAQLMACSPADLKIELGNIWLSPCAQGTGAMREATALMVAHAFGLGFRRVEWKCNALNERSRRAALSYGFRYEGTQEAHMILKGRNRDTAWFRKLAQEEAGEAEAEAARRPTM